MGYKIYYDPATAWMLAAAAMAVFGLAWHVISKLRATPWDPQASQDSQAKDQEASHAG
ncbi:MAG: hypothetical protein JKY27_06830 [Magnetovibrio sp.]|nr:hypothetical protein [Magnetovibrio sp.]